MGLLPVCFLLRIEPLIPHTNVYENVQPFASERSEKSWEEKGIGHDGSVWTRYQMMRPMGIGPLEKEKYYREITQQRTIRDHTRHQSLLLHQSLLGEKQGSYATKITPRNSGSFHLTPNLIIYCQSAAMVRSRIRRCATSPTRTWRSGGGRCSSRPASSSTVSW